MRNVRIRSATVDDAPAIAAIHVATWRDAYKAVLPAGYLANLDERARARTWRKMLLAGRPHVLVAHTEAAVVAWLAFGPARDDDLDDRYAEVEAIYVASAFWNRGAGTALMDAACARLRIDGYRAVALWVLEDNSAARGFYERRGFARDGASKAIQIGGTSHTELRLVRAIAIAS